MAGRQRPNKGVSSPWLRSALPMLQRMAVAAADTVVAARAVEVRGLAKSYDDVEAVRGIDFDVAAGEVFGFLGPNGAGKSTTINMLCTLAKPTGGSATVAGHDVVRERDEVRRQDRKSVV